jgi:hypothetical protein
MPETLEERMDNVERQNIRIETILEQYEKRFGQVEAAMNRLTWTVSLWGGVITILLGLFLTLGKR